MRNGWFCHLKFGNDEEGFSRGKAYVSATVFRLVKKRKDKVSFDDADYLMGRRYLPPPDVLKDASKAVGEVQVFGAEEFRSSLFATGVENFNATYVAVGCFIV
ncbi:hypothetical protein RHMOL_Rhmol03G0197800 [Rhododendron molle]|uniref:Uncharacterized protein n=1 Tax=Rhododendron molle TaxID=49168 RepID=A0ACC0PHT9_RHOML|nr:hypothetical protein RHMOL_Rhmol03G0197800 [Rhododendron molle]